MDYREEQANEVEALESIYCGELDVLGTEPHKFCIRIKTDSPEDKGGLACTVKFTYTDKYPDEMPLLELVEQENFTDADKKELMNFLTTQAEKNLGMVMVFTLVSSAQEWLSTRWDQIKENKEMEAERRLREKEEEEMKKFEGTRVTIESFLNWKRAFEEEMGLNKKEPKEEREGRKLTGKELFLQDQTLAESDLKYLEDGGDGIKVDESLFENLDELGLEDTELDDP